MDALLSQQGEWRVSAVGLRESMPNYMQEAIYPTYKEFFEKYSVIKFSKKHMERYLRYNPEEVKVSLVSFFGAGTVALMTD